MLVDGSDAVAAVFVVVVVVVVVVEVVDHVAVAPCAEVEVQQENAVVTAVALLHLNCNKNDHRS